jgi:hypothetical protein
MKIRDVVDILSGRIIVDNHDLDEEVPRGGAADLMSDVLAFGTEGMAGINVIVIVRDKTPPPETLELARESGITIINTGYTMYEACGRLFNAGLPGLGQVKMQDNSW